MERLPHFAPNIIDSTVTACIPTEVGTYFVTPDHGIIKKNKRPLTNEDKGIVDWSAYCTEDPEFIQFVQEHALKD